MKKTLVIVLVVVLVVIAGLWLWGYTHRLLQGPAVATTESGEITPEIRQTLNSLLGVAGTPHSTTPAPPPNEVQWIAAQNGSKPANALSSGDEFMNHNPGSPRTLYVCRAAHGNGVHLGKLVGGACNIGYGGQEVEIHQYEVAVYIGGSWGNRGLNGALVGGYENNANYMFAATNSFIRN